MGTDLSSVVTLIVIDRPDQPEAVTSPHSHHHPARPFANRTSRGNNKRQTRRAPITVKSTKLQQLWHNVPVGGSRLRTWRGNRASVSPNKTAIYARTRGMLSDVPMGNDNEVNRGLLDW